MTERKPAGVSWETFIERQIREAHERGEFDDLPGAGKPIADLGAPRDDLWWVRRKLRDERLATLPPTLQIRRDLELAREAITRAPSERAVRAIATEISARIREVNRTDVTGPPSTVMPLDVEATVARWREAREARGGRGGGRASR